MRATDEALEVTFNFRGGESFVLAGTAAGGSPKWLVPRQFVARGNRLDPGVHIEMRIEVDRHGVPRCVGLELQPHEGGSITTDVLRNVPVRQLVDAALVEVAIKVEDLPAGGVSGELFSPQDREDFKAVRRPRRGERITAKQLDEIAKIYKRALAAGEYPTRAVMRDQHVARSTASRWIAKARAEGLLPPADPKGGKS